MFTSFSECVVNNMVGRVSVLSKKIGCFESQERLRYTVVRAPHDRNQTEVCLILLSQCPVHWRTVQGGSPPHGAPSIQPAAILWLHHWDTWLPQLPSSGERGRKRVAVLTCVTLKLTQVTSASSLRPEQVTWSHCNGKEDWKHGSSVSASCFCPNIPITPSSLLPTQNTHPFFKGRHRCPAPPLPPADSVGSVGNTYWSSSVWGSSLSRAFWTKTTSHILLSTYTQYPPRAIGIR